MQAAAQGMEFEKAAVLRDQIIEMRQVLLAKETAGDKDIPEWERLRKLDARKT
jgi:excinuclease UvrABC nuclease subunit